MPADLTAYALLVPAFPFRYVASTVGSVYLLSCTTLVFDERRFMVARELVKGAAFQALGLAVAWVSERAHRANSEMARKFKLEMQEHNGAVSGVHQLLSNTLPAPVLLEIASGSKRVAHRYDDVTVLQADMVGFTSLSATREPTEMLNILGELFNEFDVASEKLGVHKLKTIGDAYIVCCGAFGGGSIPFKNSGQRKAEEAAQRVVRMGLQMQEIMASKAAELDVDVGRPF